MTIALLCPSRMRHDKCRRMIKSAYDTTGGNLCVYVGVSPDEFDIYKAELEGVVPEGSRVEILLVAMPELLPTAQKWNDLAELALKSPVTHLMLAADDMVFSTPLWDKALKDSYDALENKIHVYALRDSRDVNGTPHPIVTKEYVEKMGYFVPPLFLHWFVDSWTVEIAKANDCFTHLNDYLLVHDKPSDKGIADSTHVNIRSYGWHRRDMWVNNAMQHVLGAEKQRLLA